MLILLFLASNSAKARFSFCKRYLTISKVQWLGGVHNMLVVMK